MIDIFFVYPNIADLKGISDLGVYLRSNAFLDTRNAWILQTYAFLQCSSTVNPILVSDIPEHGIFIALSNDISSSFMPSRDQFWVSVIADGCVPPFSHYRIVQNPKQAQRIPRSSYVPHWPQPGLTPRSTSRGNHFTRIAYFGDACNLDPYLRSKDFLLELAEYNLELEIRDCDSPANTDYSDIDAIIAIRRLNQYGFIRKPASKLFNAWNAGVLPILGNEYAYRHEGSPSNYFEASDLEKLRAILAYLCANESARTEALNNGKTQQSRISTSAIAQIWDSLIAEQVVPRAIKQCHSTALSNSFMYSALFIEAKYRASVCRVSKLLGISGSIF